MTRRLVLNWQRTVIGCLLGGFALAASIAGAVHVSHQMNGANRSCPLPSKLPTVLGSLPVLAIAVISIVISSRVPPRRHDWGGVIKDGGILGLAAIVVTLVGLLWLGSLTCGGE